MFWYKKNKADSYCLGFKTICKSLMVHLEFFKLRQDEERFPWIIFVDIWKPKNKIDTCQNALGNSGIIYDEINSA